MSLQIVPLTLREANEFVANFHRHNKPTHGGKFAVGAVEGEELVGIWQQMGGKRMVTYTLQEESGSSLRGAGWKIVGETKPTESGWDRKNRKRDWQPIYGQLKFRWEA